MSKNCLPHLKNCLVFIVFFCCIYKLYTELRRKSLQLWFLLHIIHTIAISTDMLKRLCVVVYKCNSMGCYYGLFHKACKGTISTSNRIVQDRCCWGTMTIATHRMGLESVGAPVILRWFLTMWFWSHTENKGTNT